VRNQFSLRRSSHDDLSIIHLEGFVDAHTARDFERAVQADVDAGRYRLVVDCEKLNYISSAGLGVFMGFIEEVREHGGDIKICGLRPKVREVFDMLGFPTIYDVVKDVPAAVQRYIEAPSREA
jgi:anti-sigma B factor antagonist